MLNTTQRFLMIDPAWSDSGRALLSVLAAVCLATAAALQAGDVDQIEVDMPETLDLDDGGDGDASAIEAGAVSFVTALIIAAALLCAWVGLRSL